MELELDRVRREILRILYMPGPPVPIKKFLQKVCLCGVLLVVDNYS